MVPLSKAYAFKIASAVLRGSKDEAESLCNKRPTCQKPLERQEFLCIQGLGHRSKPCWQLHGHERGGRGGDDETFLSLGCNMIKTFILPNPQLLITSLVRYLCGSALMTKKDQSGTARYCAVLTFQDDIHIENPFYVTTF